MSDEPPSAAHLSSQGGGRELLTAALLEGFHEAIDGQIEVVLQRRSSDSADPPADSIAGQISVAILAPTVLSKMRGIYVDLNAPTDPIN